MLRDEIRELVSILKEEDVDEIEVRRLWTTIRVAKRRGPERAGASRHEAPSGEAAWGGSYSGTHGTRSEGPPALSERGAAVLKDAREVHSSAGAPALDQIVSPMVGTFYRARDPQSEPFAYEGKSVREGEILCIIEAMKLMNEVESDKDGIIRKILVKDAQPVEYGQPLFLVESA